MNNDKSKNLKVEEKISKEQAIIQFQNYSGNVISRMSNLGFILKSLCFTYNSFFILLLSNIYEEKESTVLIIILILLVNFIINLGFAFFNFIFLRLERWFRDYQKLKINHYDYLDFKEIIKFQPNQSIDNKTTQKQSFRAVFFSFSIFWFYIFVSMLNTILITLIFLI